MKNLLFVVLLATLFAACEEIIEVELPEGETVLVVEATITTENKPWEVHLTSSQAYFNQDDISYITQAEVIISDDAGNSDTLFHVDSSLYKTKTNNQCIAGRNYTLTINYQGQSTEATEFCNFQNEIDTFTSYFLPDNNGFIQAGNYTFMKSEEWMDVGNHYWWKLYQNDTFIEGFGYLLESDELGPGTPNDAYFNSRIDINDPLAGLADNIIPRPFPFNFEPGDSIRLEQFSISKQFYDFLFEVQNQANQGGTPFDPPPANPINNLSDNALGYFTVANMKVANTVIPE